MTAQAETITKRIRDEYGAEPEYLWPEVSPNHYVFRRHDNKKWFGIVMTISGRKLGLGTDKLVEIINVKFDCGAKNGGGGAAEFAAGRTGIFPAYHMNKRNWITIMLDGTLEDEEIMGLVERSFGLTG